MDNFTKEKLKQAADLIYEILGYEEATKETPAQEKPVFYSEFRVVYDKNNPAIAEAWHKEQQALNETTKKETLVLNSGKSSKKEVEEDLTRLKYGNGSISKVERLNKNGTIYKYWRGRYMLDGKQRTVTAKTQKQCYERLMAITANIVPKAKKPNVKSGAFADWVKEWFYKYHTHKVKESTRKEYERFIKNFACSELGKMPLIMVTTNILQSYLLKIEKPNTRKKERDIMNAALKKAVALEMLRKNPMELVEIPSVKSKPRRAYTFDEQNEMLKAFSKKYAPVFKFLCCTGLRAGEFVALKEKNIDRRKKLIWVTESIAANVNVVDDPKTDSSVRAVPYLDELFDGIELGTYTYAGIKKAFTTALEKCEISGVFIHNTRHTFSSICYYCDVPDKYIQAWMGHSTVAMTMDTYTHILNGKGSVIVDYIARLRDACCGVRA